MNITKLYNEFTIKFVEERVIYLRSKVYSHNFFDWLFRKIYKKHLIKYENLLLEKYVYLNNIVHEEIKSQKIK